MNDLRYQTILVPLDCSLRAECALPVAVTLAQTHQAQLLLAHFVRKPEMPRDLWPAREEVELVGLVINRRQQEARKYFDRLRSRLPVDFQDILQVCENVPVSLHELVETHAIDLLILSAHGSSGEYKWPFGSITNNLIQYGTTQLLIVQDFSPNQIEISRAELLAREHSGH